MAHEGTSDIKEIELRHLFPPLAESPNHVNVPFCLPECPDDPKPAADGLTALGRKTPGKSTAPRSAQPGLISVVDRLHLPQFARDSTSRNHLYVRAKMEDGKAKNRPINVWRETPSSCGVGPEVADSTPARVHVQHRGLLDHLRVRAVLELSGTSLPSTEDETARGGLLRAGIPSRFLKDARGHPLYDGNFEAAEATEEVNGGCSAFVFSAPGKKSAITLPYQLTQR